MTYQTSNTPATFDIDLETVAFAVARNQCGAKIPIDDLLTELGLTPTEFLEFADDPIFKRSVQLFAKEMTENGVSFQMKARLQAEELLKKQWKVIHDPDTPPAVVEKMISNTVRWAGLEQRPAQSDENAGGSAQKIQISINLGRADEYEARKIEATAERLPDGA